jgi:hypothetical protein
MNYFQVLLSISTCAATQRRDGDDARRGHQLNTRGRAVHVDSIKTHVESAYGFSAWNYHVMIRFQTLLSNLTCAATAR